MDPQYDTDALSGTIPNTTGTGFGFVVLNYPVNGIQNGAPDGIALVDNTNNLVQFLSYEGSFVGVGGAADGITSTDVGVSEIGNESTGLSLQLTGTGTTYQDFTWASPATETPDAVNNGQTFGAAPPDTTPPTIASTDPADSATNVALDSNITVNFNEPVSIAGGCHLGRLPQLRRTRSILHTSIQRQRLHFRPKHRLCSWRNMHCHSGCSAHY
jgi:hypothetical protein